MHDVGQRKRNAHNMHLPVTSLLSIGPMQCWRGVSQDRTVYILRLVLANSERYRPLDAVRRLMKAQMAWWWERVQVFWY